MKKDAYYFSHDSNARHDEKILAMRSVYKSEGYGWYWVVIELMRDANAYRLQCNGKYWYHALAVEMQTEPEKALNFITDCINEFQLFSTDGQFIWSESLLRRMEEKESKSKAARKAIQKRWETGKGVTEKHTDVSKTDTIKESKGNESKEKETKVPVLATQPASAATTTHQIFADRLLSDEGQREREAIEKQTRTLLTPNLLHDFQHHLTTGAKNHQQIAEFNTHLRNWLNTRPKARAPDNMALKKKVV